jgi:hypothetical protein
MWVYSTDKPISTHPGGARTEIKINVRLISSGHSAQPKENIVISSAFNLMQEVYRSGVWQFEGEAYVPAGTTGASIMQIFGAAPVRGRATTLMLHVYDGDLTFYHDLQRVLAENIYDRWIRLNVIHDMAASNITVYIDGDEKLSYRGPGAPDAPHYFKFGVYKQSHHQPSYLMESRWRNVAVFTKP